MAVRSARRPDGRHSCRDQHHAAALPALHRFVEREVPTDATSQMRGGIVPEPDLPVERLRLAAFEDVE